MSNTSASKGILVESPTHTRTQLEDVWWAVLAGMSKLPSENVRIGYQVNPARVPGAEVDWMAFYLEDDGPEDHAEEIHISDDDGSSIIVDQVHKIARISIYGPHAGDIASTIRRSFYIGQNRDSLLNFGVGIQRIGAPISVPEYHNEKYLRRADLDVYFVWEQVGMYSVLNLLSAFGRVDTDVTNDAPEQLVRDIDTLKE